MKTAAHFPTQHLRKVVCPFCAGEFARESVKETCTVECPLCGEPFLCVVHENDTRSTYFPVERAA